MIEEVVTVQCHQCQTEQKTDYKFCGNCGAKNIALFKKSVKTDLEYNDNLRLLSIYCAIIAASLIFNFIIEDSLASIVIISIGFALLDIVFATIQPSVWKVVFRKIQLTPLLWIIPTFCATGFIVSYLMDHLNFLLFENFYVASYLDFFSETEHPFIYTLIIVAVFPAIFEELAFRGFLFNNLKKIGGENSAIWASSFLFALVHFSILSLIWIFPFGLILAKIRNKYSTIIYGVIAHFIHNGTVTAIEYYIGNWAY